MILALFYRKPLISVRFPAFWPKNQPSCF